MKNQLLEKIGKFTSNLTDKLLEREKRCPPKMPMEVMMALGLMVGSIVFLSYKGYEDYRTDNILKRYADTNHDGIIDSDEKFRAIGHFEQKEGIITDYKGNQYWRGHNIELILNPWDISKYNDSLEVFLQNSYKISTK